MQDGRCVELFGGAITSVFPITAVDVSDFRQVPDTQEVYTETETGMCIIIELLSRQREVSDSECGTFFFNDLARANDCRDGDYTIDLKRTLSSTECPQVSQRCAYGSLTSGMQRVSKYTNERGKENDVFVTLAVLRFLPPISSDVLLSISAPQWIHPDSSEAHVVRRIRGKEEVQEIMQRMLLTFNVLDWNLFVPEE